MKRNINSNRTQKWIKRNDLLYESTRQKISSHCEKNNICYYIKKSNESFTLCIFINNNYIEKVGEKGYYEIYFDREELALKTIYVNEEKRWIINRYYKNDCWYKAIEDVVNVLYIKNIDNN